MPHSTTPYHYVLAYIVTIVWGFNFVFAKTALQYFEPFTMLTLRLLIVAILLIPFFPKPPIPLHKIVLIAFTFVILHLGTMFWSLDIGLDASVGIVALQLHTPFLLLFGTIFFKETIEREYGGIILGSKLSLFVFL